MQHLLYYLMSASAYVIRTAFPSPSVQMTKLRHREVVSLPWLLQQTPTLLPPSSSEG